MLNRAVLCAELVDEVLVLEEAPLLLVPLPEEVAVAAGRVEVTTAEVEVTETVAVPSSTCR